VCVCIGGMNLRIIAFERPRGSHMYQMYQTLVVLFGRKVLI
jgi:hypothetical protein